MALVVGWPRLHVDHVQVAAEARYFPREWIFAHHFADPGIALTIAAMIRDGRLATYQTPRGHYETRIQPEVGHHALYIRYLPQRPQ